MIPFVRVSKSGHEHVLITRHLVTEYGATAGCNGCQRQVDIINEVPGAVSMKRPFIVNHTLACRDRFRILLNDNDDDTGKKLNTTRSLTPWLAQSSLNGPILSDTVQEDGCDDRPCPKRFCVDAFHKGTTETPGSLAGSSTHAGSSSQASNCSATESTSGCSATEVKDDIEDVLMVDFHRELKEMLCKERRTRSCEEEFCEGISRQAAAAVEKDLSPHEEKHDQIRFHLAEGLGRTRLKERKYSPGPIHLTRKDIEEFGWTRSCRKCQMMRGLQKGSQTRRHSRQCRNRIISELAKTSAGQVRFAKFQARKLFEKTLEKRCNVNNG